MNRPIQVILALLFLLPAVPIAEGTHLVPRDVDPMLPDVPEEPLVATDIKPVSDLQVRAAATANGSLDPARAGLADAKARAAAESWAQPLPDQVVLFTDRLEGDRIGAYGPWNEVGPHAWGVGTWTEPQPNASGAGPSNDTVLTTGILAGNRYPGNVVSLLSTPELDLRTGFGDVGNQAGSQLPAGGLAGSYGDVQKAYADNRKSIPPTNPPALGPVGTNALPTTLPNLDLDVGLSKVYRTIYQALDNVVNAGPAPGRPTNGLVCNVIQVPLCVPGPGSLVGGIDTDSREGAYVLEFQRRFNLARNGDNQGRDGVRILVFTQPPTFDLVGRCMEASQLGDRRYFAGELPGFIAGGTDAQGNPTGPGAIDPPCTIPRLLDRDTSPQPLPTAAFNGSAAFTGYDNWRASAVDLTPWAERSVWVGFLFASGNAAGDAYFRNPGLFTLDEQRRAEFFGYQLDDLRLTAPGVSHSVRVRPIDDPWYAPFGQDLPTVAIGEPIPIGTDIANVGTRPVDIDLSARVVWRGNQTTAWERSLGNIHLEPRGLHRVAETVPGLTADLAHYTVIVDATKSRSTGDAQEADPRDSRQAQPVDVGTITHLVPGLLERGASSYSTGDTATFTLRLSNDGNAPLQTVAVAELVNAISQSVVQDAPFAHGTPRMQSVTVPPDGPAATDGTVLRWELPLPDAGQYRLFVRLDDNIAFEAEKDLRPRSLQPQDVLQLIGPAPTIDGTLVPGEWPTAAFSNVTLRDIYDNGGKTPAKAVRLARMALATNATHLHLALDVPLSSNVGRVRFLLDNGGSEPLTVTGIRETYAGSGATGHRMAEASVPLADVQMGPDDVVRLLTIVDDGQTGAAITYSYTFPWIGPQDGEGLQPPNESPRDEMDSWLALRLFNAPGNRPQRLLSLGIGVDRAPPPMLQLDTSNCANLAGWTQSFVRNPGLAHGYDAQGVKWNCAPYGPDGVPLLYEGRTPNAVCNGQPCGQWNAIENLPGASCCYGGTDAVPFNLGGDETTRGNGAYRPNVLVSPPIQIAAIPDPYLVLRHQYSTEVYFNDEDSAVASIGYVSTSPHQIQSQQRARIYLQEWSAGTESWGTAVLLRPEGGRYTTEDSLGIVNPAAPRTMRGSFADGWWWPTGDHPHFKPTGLPVASGQQFSGSPWKVDRIPLFGTHGASEPPATSVDTSGKTVRLLFAIDNAIGEPRMDVEKPRDYGWRISGLAVTEGPQFSRDLAVVSVKPVAPRYDPVALGLGPGASLPVNITIRNQGNQAVEGIKACLRAVPTSGDAGSASDACDGNHAKGEFALRLLPGATATVNLTTLVPNQEGTKLTFLASSFPLTGDDFSFDNTLHNSTVFEVRSSPNLAISVGTDQLVASPEEARNIFVRIENRGNVPVSGFEVRRTISLGDVSVLDPDQADHWIAVDSLDVGEAKGLDEIAMTPAVVPSTDLRMRGVSESGAYTLAARVMTAGDIDSSDDNAILIVRTQDILQDGNGRPVAQAFSDPSSAEGLLLQGTPGIWSVPVGGSLLAGNPATGEIPLSADGSIELTSTPIDLRSARQATLSLRHRYEFEAAPGGGFDAGLVEISTNDGATWRPLRPMPSPLQGLPEGYPSIPLTGDTALAAASNDQPAVAFTGKSADIPGAQDGWIRSVFDLGQDPDLSRTTAFESFSLAGFPAQADQRAERGAESPNEFLNKDWILREPNAEGRQRYWWIENLTYAPNPHSGSTMWWSGTAGPDNREESSSGGAKDPTELVQDQLDYAFTVQPVPGTPGTPTQLMLTWWQWRAGDADGGTGSRQTVRLLQGQTDLGRSASLLEEDARTGWTRWGMALDGLQGPLTLRFDYDSAVRTGFPDPTTANNRGWFLDDFQQVLYGFDLLRQVRYAPTNLTDVETLEAISRQDLEDGTAGPWTTRKVDGNPPRANIVWSLVGRGAGATDGGWHVAPVEVPGQGELPGWRFADSSRQGYPYSAESRLVTPLVDLSQATGDLRLRFDHQYWFEARTKCPLDQLPEPSAEGRLAQGCFLSAIDGGNVEYQIFDPATQSFGPWQALAKGFDDFPETLYFDAKADDCSAYDRHAGNGADLDPPSGPPFNGPCANHLRVVDRLANLPGNRIHTTYGGYPAIEERGAYLEETHDRALTGVSGRPAGQGTLFGTPSGGLSQTQFETAAHSGCGSCSAGDVLQPWASFPVSYVFSGASKALHPRTDGWANEAWDVAPLQGKQVRFAFHAASNPGLQSEDGRPSDAADRGWSLANIRLEGDALDGKPVRLRLRVATDSSLGAGEWRIDEAVVAGERFANNAAVLSDGPSEIVADRAETVRFDGRFTTLGNEPLEGIIATLSAVRESDLAPYTGPVALALPSCAVGQPPETCLAAEIDDPGSVRPDAVAALRLKPLDLGLQPSIPFQLSVRLPAADESILLRWDLWKDSGQGNYVPFPLDVPGNARAEWVARGLRTQSVVLASPMDGQSRHLVPSPGDALPGDLIAVMARVQNTGTTEPTLKAHWTVERVDHKASSGQANSGTEKSPQVAEASFSINGGDPLARGTGASVLDAAGDPFSFRPAVAGLYRITLSVKPSGGGDELAKESLEILVGLPSTYHATDFAITDATASGWLDASSEPRADGGGSPEEIRFRSADGRLLWGRTDSEFGAGQTYCSAPSTCSFAVATANQGDINPPARPPPVFGLEGIAIGPAITLDRVPQGQAFVTVRQDHNFEADDGARVEFLPLDASDLASHAPAFLSPTCPGGALTFSLPPLHYGDLDGTARSLPATPYRGRPTPPSLPSDYVRGEHAPQRHNPLLLDINADPERAFDPANEIGLAQAAIGGPPARNEILRYDLASLATPTCRDQDSQPTELRLVNYTVVPVLRVGTRPGAVVQEPEHPNDRRTGGQGWGIHSIQVSSVAVEASPDAPTYPVQVGAPKTFFVTVTNLGQVEDRFMLSLDAAQATVRDPDWLSFPQPFSLGPGESRRLPVRVDVPANEQGQAGNYAAPILVSSLTDPMTRDTVQARLDVRRLLLPDLALTLVGDLAPGEGFEAGRVYPVHATVFNVGGATSRPTELVLEATDSSGNSQPVERLSVPRLCAPGGASVDCAASRATLTIEWTAPAAPGQYRLVGRLDPAGAMDEESESNNVVELAADVSPLHEPDLALTDLVLEGVTNGVVEEGSLVVVTANATNHGNSAAHNVRIKIRFGSSTLREVFLPTLDPGQQVSASAAKVVSRGEFIVGASVTHDAVDANIDDDDLRQPLRVRGHELVLATWPANATVIPGATTTFQLNVTNHGNSVERAAVRLDPSTKGWSLRVLPNPLTVAPDRTGIATLELTAPADALAGPTHVRLLATPSGQAPSVARLDVPMTVATRSDAPKLTMAPQGLAPGAGAIALLVNNTSNAAREVTLDVESPHWTTAALPLHLEPRSDRSVALPVTVPANASVGKHALTLVLRDANGSLLARQVATLDVTGRPAASAAWSGAAQREGDELGMRRATFILKVRNDGNIPLTPSITLRGLADGLSEEGVRTSPLLAPGDSWRAPVSVTLAPNVTAPFGLAELWIAVGNATPLRTSVLPLPTLDDAPDLRIASMQVSPTTLTAGQPARIRASVANQGAVEAPASVLFVSVNGLLVEPVDVPPIPAGTSHDLDVTVTFTKAGPYLISLLADGDSNVTELEDADNGRSVAVKVADGDLTDRLGAPAPTAAPLVLAVLALAMALRRRRGDQV